MISRKSLFGKLDLTCFRAIESATALAKIRGHKYVELIHWIHQLLQFDDGDLQRICRYFDIDMPVLGSDLERAMASLPSGAATLVDFSRHIENSIEKAWIFSTLEFNGRCVRGAWLILAIFQDAGLRRALFDASSMFSRIAVETLHRSMPGIVAGSPEENEQAHDGSGLPGAMPGEASSAIPRSDDNRRSSLERYCTDLAQQARVGRIDPVIARSTEIRALIDILMRRRQNNPLLIGDAGVGKTAVVEGLARAIAEDLVPSGLIGARLLSLDIGALLAGASMRGEFEARLKGVIEEATASTQPCILFIDEAHVLVGAGGQAGTGDAANLLKPALARGALRVIGATTWQEYQRHIAKDPALVRRFQVLQVPEPEEDRAIDMVRGVAMTFSRHHGVTILDEAVRAAVVLSRRYMPERQLPDKAIGLLDTACAQVSASLHAPPASVLQCRQEVAALHGEVSMLQAESIVARGTRRREERLLELDALLVEACGRLDACEDRWDLERALVRDIQASRISNDWLPVPDEAGMPAPVTYPSSELQALEKRLEVMQGDVPLARSHVDEAAVAAVVSSLTGIPAARLAMHEVESVLNLQASLERRVIGQSSVLQVVADRVRTARAHLNDPCKPVGVFLLAGPSGVGKTETALALAEILHGSEHHLVTLHMSEFQEPHSVATLKGSPPGYVGYGEGGVLTEAVRRRPHCIVLLDEAEKAHPDVLEMFYQVFDKGCLEDAAGRSVDFRHATILLTVNTGAEQIVEACAARGSTQPDDETLRAAIGPALRVVFPSAFLGRLCILPFRPLTQEVLRSIVEKQLRRLAGRMHRHHGIELVHTPALVTHVVAQCAVHETGARLLTGFLEQHLLPDLSASWLDSVKGSYVIERITADAAVHDASSGPAGKRIVCQVERTIPA